MIRLLPWPPIVTLWRHELDAPRRRVRVAPGTHRHLIIEPRRSLFGRRWVRVTIPLPFEVYGAPFHALAHWLRQRNDGESTTLSSIVFDVGEGYQDASERFGGWRN